MPNNGGGGGVLLYEFLGPILVPSDIRRLINV